MADSPYDEGSESIIRSEHISPVKTGDNIEAKRSASYVWDTVSSSWVRMTQPGGSGGTITNDGTFATPAKQDTGNAALVAIQTDTDYRFSGGKTAFCATITTSGNSDLIVPASGHHLEVYWVSLVPSSDNSNANLASVGFGTSGGSISTELYRCYVTAHWERFVGATNQSLIINTANTGGVAVTVHYIVV